MHSSLGQPVSQACQAEMRDFAIQIFENYQINPVIVAKCETEIHTHCKHLIGRRDDGDMMDCLMTVATNNSLSEQCFNAVGFYFRHHFSFICF